MDIEKETLKNKKKLIIALLELKLRNINDSGNIWNLRACYMVESIYSFYDKVPKNESNIDVRELMALDTLITYSSTCCFPKLRNYIMSLPGVKECSLNQSLSTYESHGFLTMQVTETLTAWENFYLDQEFKKFKIDVLGVKYFVDKYKKEINISGDFKPIRYFKNGVINLLNPAISIISEDLKITTYYLDENTNITSIEESELLMEDDSNFPATISKEHIDFIFNKILPRFKLEEIRNMGNDNFDILNVTEDLDELEELIELNYSY